MVDGKNIFDISIDFSIPKKVRNFMPNLHIGEMIVEIISKYLETNKRLVVPNLGAFIVKEAGHVVLFSNLIKADDGVLRSLIMAEGVSELESAAAIDRFVFEVNFRLENTAQCLLGGFGELHNGANGTITFIYKPTVKGDNLDGNVAPRKPVVEPQPAAESVKRPVEQPKVVEPTIDVDGDISIDVVPRKEPTPHRSVGATERKERTSYHAQDDYVKGLRYGKGRKVVTGRESATSRKSQKSDIIIKIAIVAAVLAILALAYGVYNEWQISRYDEPMIDNSEIYEQVPESAESGMRNPDLDYIQKKSE